MQEGREPAARPLPVRTHAPIPKNPPQRADLAAWRAERIADLPTGTGCEMSINLIPHTVENTALGNLRTGSSVNLEVDLIARYCERMLNMPAVLGRANQTPR